LQGFHNRLIVAGRITAAGAANRQVGPLERVILVRDPLFSLDINGSQAFIEGELLVVGFAFGQVVFSWPLKRD
jgi:hypothetical protein